MKFADQNHPPGLKLAEYSTHYTFILKHFQHSVIVGWGGGSTCPSLETLAELRCLQWDIEWVGGASGVESDVVHTFHQRLRLHCRKHRPCNTHMLPDSDL